MKRVPTRSRVRPTCLLILGLAAGQVPSATALAAELTVTSTQDDTRNPVPGSLREAVLVRAQVGDTIRFDVSGPVELRGSLTLPSSLSGLTLTGPVRIDGRRTRGGLALLGIKGNGLSLVDLDLENVGVLATGFAPTSTGVTDLTIRGCRFGGKAFVRLRFAAGAQLRDNVWDDVRPRRGEVALRLDTTRDCTVTDNEIRARSKVVVDEREGVGLDFTRNEVVGRVWVTARSGTLTDNDFTGDPGVFVRAGDLVPEAGHLDIQDNRFGALSVERTDVTISGNRLALAAAPGRGRSVASVLRVVSFDSKGPRGDVVVEDNIIEGGEFGLFYTEARDRAAPGIIRRNTVSGAVGVGVLVTSGADVLIESNTITNVGRSSRGGGLRVDRTRGDGVVVRSNTVTDTSGTGVSVEPTGALVVEGNTVTGSTQSALAVALGRHSETGAVRIADNVLEDGSTTVLMSGRRSRRVPLEFVDNQVSGGERVGVLAENLDGLLAQGNDVRDCGDSTERSAGIELSGVRGGAITLVGNVIEDIAGDGVRLDVKGDVRVESNTVRRSALIGVHIDGRRTDAELVGNTVEDSGGAGVRFEKRTTGRVAGGRVRGNAQSGVYVGNRAEVEITQVSTSTNGGAGIDVEPPGVTHNAERKKGNRDLDWPTDLRFDADTQKVRGRSVGGARIDVYEVESGGRSGNPQNGEGVAFLGSTTAGPDGGFTYPPSGDLPCPTGRRITLTATVAVGSESPVTSEFSDDVLCEPRDTLEWVPMTSPTTENLLGLWVVSADEAYAAGRLGTLIRWDGTDWLVVQAAADQHFVNVVARGPADVLALTTRSILATDGMLAPAEELPAPLHAGVQGTGFFGSAWASTDGRVFVPYGSGGSPGSPRKMLRYDGAAWAPMWVEDTPGVAPTNFDRAPAAVWGPSGSHAFTVTDQGQVWEWDGNAATKEIGPDTHVGRWDAHSHVGTEASRQVNTTDMWGAGEHLYVTGENTFVRRGAAAWSVLHDRPAWSVWARSQSEIYILRRADFQVGDDFATLILVSDGETTRTMTTPEPLIRMNRVRGDDQETTFAVGDNGTILRHVPPE